MASKDGKKIAWQDFPCPICSSSDLKVLYDSTLGNDFPEFGYNFTPSHNRMYRVVRCKKCTHTYSSPRPKNLYVHYKDVADAEYLKNEEQRRLTAERALQTIVKFKPANSKLLDIGCATGDFIRVASREYSVEGLELSKWAYTLAKKQGLKIHNHEISKLKKNEFDIVTLWGVIEHFEYPSVEIRHINRAMKQDGILCLWTGNFDSWPAKLLGRKWWYMQGQHIQLFTRKSIDKLFRDNGFEGIYSSNYAYVMSCASLAKSLQRYPIIGKIANWLLNLKWLAHRKITFKLPGEMFLIYRKV